MQDSFTRFSYWAFYSFIFEFDDTALIHIPLSREHTHGIMLCSSIPTCSILSLLCSEVQHGNCIAVITGDDDVVTGKNCNRNVFWSVKQQEVPADSPGPAPISAASFGMRLGDDRCFCWYAASRRGDEDGDGESNVPSFSVFLANRAQGMRQFQQNDTFSGGKIVQAVSFVSSYPSSGLEILTCP